MKPPFKCRIKSIFNSKKPTNFYGCCIGLKPNKKCCKECENYIPGLIKKGFEAGLISANVAAEAFKTLSAEIKKAVDKECQ